MELEDSMREIIQQAKEGDDAAVRRLWDRYFPQIVRLAGQRLVGQRQQVTDGEDVAISVLESFFRAADAGRFPDLNDADGVWRLLAQMTRRKVIDVVRRNAARPVIGESALDKEAQQAHPISSIASDDPTPTMLAMVADEVQRLLRLLPDKYHTVALKKLECYTVGEIAAYCGVHVSTVERRLRIIRGFWEKEFGSTRQSDRDGSLAIE